MFQTCCWDSSETIFLQRTKTSDDKFRNYSNDIQSLQKSRHFSLHSSIFDSNDDELESEKRIKDLLLETQNRANINNN